MKGTKGLFIGERFSLRGKLKSSSKFKKPAQGTANPASTHVTGRLTFNGRYSVYPTTIAFAKTPAEKVVQEPKKKTHAEKAVRGEITSAEKAG
ncbi:hypothetical protein TIFTF001_033833 [Ficus carica]|uniref:Uncharacterized protein n=1 Tax=Ficus carica TaxID=3494 RepID=A0AA88J8D7_FICCA|nr:hypothetical protein TIFTF001_033833 [Ficus carica]